MKNQNNKYISFEINFHQRWNLSTNETPFLQISFFPPLFSPSHPKKPAHGSDSHYSRVYVSRVKKRGKSRGTPPRLELHPSKDVDTCRDLQSRNYGYTIGNDTGWTRGQSHYPPWSPTKPRDIRSAARTRASIAMNPSRENGIEECHVAASQGRIWQILFEK